LVCAALAMRAHEEVSFLHANYGQRTQNRELKSFQAICDFYRPTIRKEVDITWFSEIGGSALTDNSLKIRDYESSDLVPNTYVPFRNANLICAAVSWAEVWAASAIYIGAVEADSSGYPDCRKVFFKDMQAVIDSGTLDRTKIKLLTPLIDLSKAEIIRLGHELGAPFELSWSCYRNDDLACGTCDSCVLRLRAFSEAGLKDPIPYLER